MHRLNGCTLCNPKNKTFNKPRQQASERRADLIIQDFYQDLTTKQIPLDKDFEKVISDNIWDLYKE